MSIGAKDILDGATIRNVEHDYAHSITFLGVSILWKISRAKGCPFVDVDFGCRNNQEQASTRS